jgi:acetyl-CoA acetyltransferase
MPARLGKSNNYPRSVMNRLGGDPVRVVLEPVGGQGPQKLVTEAGNAIAAGAADIVMIMGSEPGSTARYFADRDDKPDFTEHVEGQLEDRGHQISSYIDDYTIQHGLTGAPVQYGLLENARRARLGRSVADYRREMAELFAPMSKVAAKNPLSSSPVERSVDEIITIADDNRMICDPYPRLLVARDQVNQGAAAVLMSVEAATRLGVAEDKWVFDGRADARPARAIRSRRRQRRHHEQVLGRYLLDHTGGVANRQLCGAQGGDRRAAEGRCHKDTRRRGNHRDLLRALRLAGPHRHHRRQASCGQRAIHGDNRRRRSRRFDVRRRSARCGDLGVVDRQR